MTSHRYLHIAVEVAARELESKLLLALFAHARGFSVLIGEDNFFSRNMKRLPRGIFFDKSFTQGHLRKNHLPAKRAGHFVTAIDEEGCESFDDPLSQARFFQGSLDLADLVFAWGEDQAMRVASRSPRNSDKIVVSGSQRWDLLRPEGLQFYTKRVAALREVFGDYLLVNSNFAMVSDPTVYDTVVSSIISNGLMSADDTEQIARLERRRDYQIACMHALIEGVQELAKAHPDRNIVIRPHPVESTAIWPKAFEHLKNVHVIYLGPPEPWILGARLLIVSGCTTGMQAVTMGKPTVTYCLDDDPEFRDDSLTNHVCPRASNLGDFLSVCDRLIKDPVFHRGERERGLSELGRYISALDGPFAAERMVDAFCGLVDGKRAYHHSKPLNPVKAKLDLRNPRPNNVKFPDVTQEEITARLDDLRSAFGIATAPNVSQLREKVFLLS